MSFLKGYNIKKFYKQKPPKNNSLTTLKEIQQLSRIPSDEKFARDKDNIEHSFEKITKKNGLPFPKKIVNNLLDDSANEITKIKNHFNRPRPWSLSKEFDVDLEAVKMASMKTPSYPSGHSVQGVLIGNVLAKMYPQHANEFKNEGLDISKSRRVAKAHYKSDSDFGEKIGNDMFDYIKNKV